MTFDYARLRDNTAEPLLARFGQSVTLTKAVASGDAWNPTMTETDYSATAVVQMYSNREIDGTIVLAGDKKVMLSTDGLSVTPAVGDTLTVDSVKHSVVGVEPLSPGGTVVMWTLQARR